MLDIEVFAIHLCHQKFKMVMPLSNAKIEVYSFGKVLKEHPQMMMLPLRWGMGGLYKTLLVTGVLLFVIIIFFVVAPLFV